jgi:hypothetical protein
MMRLPRMGDARRAAMQSRIAAIYCSAENLFALERSFRLNSVEKVCPIAAGRGLEGSMTARRCQTPAKE